MDSFGPVRELLSLLQVTLSKFSECMEELFIKKEC